MALNSSTWAPAVPLSRVFGVGREEADGVVAPVVAQAAFEQEAVVHEVVHRHQLHRGDAQRAQVLGRSLVGQVRRTYRAARPVRPGDAW